MTTFEVRNHEVEEKLRELGRTIERDMPEGFGFTLLIFSYEPGPMFYISSAERDGMIAAMREFIAKHEPN
jgi:hypothetical protein